MRIYIIEEQRDSGPPVTAIARRSGYEIERYSRIDAFLEATSDTDYGCVLLHIERLSERSVDLLARLAARVPAWPVVLLAAAISVDDAIAAFRHGAVHCLRKPYHPTELSNALREAIAAAEASLHGQRRVFAATAIRLSQREREVLGALAEGRQSKVIAWQLGVSVRTVDMHRSNIFAKLGARNALQAVSIARELGLLDTP